MPKRTYQPKKKKRKRKHGFRKLMRTSGGKRLSKEEEQREGRDWRFKTKNQKLKTKNTST